MSGEVLSLTDETLRPPIAGWIREIEAMDGHVCPRMRELHVLCARELARANGWRLAARDFAPSQLLRGSWQRTREEELRPWGAGDGRVFDHCEFFGHGRRPVGIVTHPYAPREEVERTVAERGLRLRWLHRSWYFPAGTSAAVITRP